MKIFAVGRNYLEHISELKSEVPDAPVIFMKPDTALVRNNDPFFYPDFSENIHYETELVVKICRVGKNISPRFAHRYYREIALGIDFTARDLQDKFKMKGLPWELSKSFDYSAPVSGFIPLEKFPDVQNLNFLLKVNEVIVQEGNTRNMIYSVNNLLCFISEYFTVKTGDLIFTGTPHGVGPVHKGDRLQGYIEGELMMDFYIK